MRDVGENAEERTAGGADGAAMEEGSASFCRELRWPRPKEKNSCLQLLILLSFFNFLLKDHSASFDHGP